MKTVYNVMINWFSHNRILKPHVLCCSKDHNLTLCTLGTALCIDVLCETRPQTSEKRLPYILISLHLVSYLCNIHDDAIGRRFHSFVTFLSGSQSRMSWFMFLFTRFVFSREWDEFLFNVSWHHNIIKSASKHFLQMSQVDARPTSLTCRKLSDRNVENKQEVQKRYNVNNST